MPRPKTKRVKWNVLNPTPQERATIRDFAAEAGMGVSAYLIERALQRPVAARQDWTRIAHQQARLITLLEQVADTSMCGDDLRGVGQILLTLRRIETEIQSWLPSGRHDDPGEGA